MVLVPEFGMVDKEAQKIRSRRWYLANLEKALARSKQQREEDHEGYLAYLRARYASIDPGVRKTKSATYHAANRARDLARMAAYREKDRDASRLRDAEKYQKRKTAVLTRCAEYYLENSAYIKKRVRKWVTANPEAASALNRNYKARKRNASGSHTGNDVIRIMALQKSKCGSCKISLKKRWHVDHIMPLKLGGSNAASNLQILCVSCNTRKSAKHPVDFARQQGLLL